MDACARLPLRVLWYARPEPASSISEGYEDYSTTSGLARFSTTRWLWGSARRPPGHVSRGARSPLGAAIAEAHSRGLIADGHTTGARGAKLDALTAAGRDPATRPPPPMRLSSASGSGLDALRHSSLRPDLPELLRAVTEETIDTSRVFFTADGLRQTPSRSAATWTVLRLAVDAGVPPTQAIQMATLNAATYLHLDDHLGGVAPGRLADLVLLPDSPRSGRRRSWPGEGWSPVRAS